MTYACDILFVLLIALDKAVFRSKLSELFTDSIVRKIGTDKVDILLVKPQIYRKSGLMLDVVRKRDKFFGELPAAVFQGFFLDIRLLLKRTVSAYRDNISPAAELV